MLNHAIGLALLLICLGPALLGQALVVKHNVNLRVGPSSGTDSLELVKPPARLSLLSPATQNSYYHARTADGKEGWVWSHNVSMVESESAPIGPAALYPDPMRTPGFTNPDVTQANMADNICSKNWSTSQIRPPTSYTNSLKKMQMQEYGDAVSDPNKACMNRSNNLGCYEEDHLISLQNGGHPRDPRNLWPEPYNTMVEGQKVGAKEKDAVEGFIHDEICFDIPNHKTNSWIPAHVSITLKRGQEILAGDWYACYVAINNQQDCQ